MTPFPKLFDPDDLTELSPTTPPPRAVDHLAVIRAAYPRIAQAIEMLWGTPELHTYMSNLIVDDRHYGDGNTRQGFPTNIMASLLVIYNKHSSGAPITDVWHGAK